MSTTVTPPSIDLEGRERRMYWAIANCLTIVRRGLTHLISQPSLIAWQLGFMNTALMVVIDKERGVTDRFRSMPMAPSAVVTGRGVSDVLHATLDLAVLAAIALVIGWRSDGGLLATLAAFGLLLWLRFSLIWLGVYLGLITPSQEAAGNLFAVAFPVGMISSVFTPPQLMPDWLGAIAMWNPVSSTANAVRELFGNPLAGGGSWIEQHALLGGDRLAGPDHRGVPAARGAQVPGPRPLTARSLQVRQASSRRTIRDLDR